MQKYYFKKGKTILVIFTIIVLLSASTTANNVKNTNNEEDDQDNTIYIEDDIYLNRIDAFLLSKGLKQLSSIPLYLDSSGYNKIIRDLVNEIIIYINFKGSIDSSKLLEIIQKYDTHITHVYGKSQFVPLQIRTDGSSDGAAWVFPTLLSFLTLGLYFPICKLIYYSSPWNDPVDVEWNVLVNRELIPIGEGLIFGYSGYVFNADKLVDDGGKCIFQLQGWGNLIFHGSFEEE